MPTRRGPSSSALAQTDAARSSTTSPAGRRRPNGRAGQSPPGTASAPIGSWPRRIMGGGSARPWSGRAIPPPPGARAKGRGPEPVAALYEQGRVSHVQPFPDLEDQLCSYSGAPGEESPDRLDALVWGLAGVVGGGGGG